jgi:hypothetical protein
MAKRKLFNVARTAAKREFYKHVETKHGLQTMADGVEIGHNNYQIISSNPLATVNGLIDADDGMGQRIGDEIMLRGLSLKFMVELNERYSDVTFRLFVIRSAKGDTPTRATLFNGVSGNKMIDTFNSERYTRLYSQTFKVVARNQGTNGGMISATGFGSSGAYLAGEDNPTLSRATRIMKIWLPGTKFARNGKIQYEQQGSQVKFFDYHILLFAYSNYSSNQDVWNVARINDTVLQLYYKDA